MCGREAPPITTLDAGPDDREIEVVWGANMGADRRAFELAGHVRRRRALRLRRGHVGAPRCAIAGGTVMYVARAGLVHRRDARDARLGPLMRAAYQRGRSLRGYIEHRGAGAVGGAASCACWPAASGTSSAAAAATACC